MARPRKVFKEPDPNRADVIVTVSYNGRTVKSELELTGLTGDLLRNQQNAQYVMNNIISGMKK